MLTETPVFDFEACNCQNLRRAARSVSHLYDEILSEAGVRITQFYILEVAYQKPEIKISDLAVLLELDRSTTSKNLRPLIRGGLIEVKRSTSDGRSKVIQITEAGREAHRRALVLWSRAQDRIQKLNGTEAMSALRDRLHALKVA